MEGFCLTGQSPQWAVVPVEEEEEMQKWHIYEAVMLCRWVAASCYIPNVHLIISQVVRSSYFRSCEDWSMHACDVVYTLSCMNIPVFHWSVKKFIQDFTSSCTNRQISSRFEDFVESKYSEFRFEHFAERKYNRIGFESFAEREYKKLNFLSRDW
jgi:hypothetical protein